MAVSSNVRNRVVPDPRSEVPIVRNLPGRAALLVAVDWFCAALATLFLFPGDVLFPALLIVPTVWIGTTSMYRLYERRFLGPGSEEFRRVVRAASAATAAAAMVYAVVIRSDRELRGVLLVLPFAALMSILVRHLVRAVTMRMFGAAPRRTLLVGAPAQARELAGVLRRDGAGIKAVGACLIAPGGVLADPGRALPVLGVVGESVGPDALAAVVRSAIAAAECDTVVMLPGPHLDAAGLRRFGWLMSDHGVDLLVAPFLVEIASSRLALRRTGGVPLLHVRAPELSRAARIPKEVAERLAAVLGMLVLAPLFGVIALAILLGDGRPVFFRQTRVGLRGEHFTMLKFRTMRTDAEVLRSELEHLNDNDGPLFKLRSDPRVTRVGQVLRRFSMDELPQLLNVAAGSMSVIGPRPPLPEEADAYTDDMRRRLLVKPGLTGLWQVSGRSDLPWEEAVRLDLGYVENWSLALDASILLKTGSAVLKGTGAY